MFHYRTEGTAPAEKQKVRYYGTLHMRVLQCKGASTTQTISPGVVAASSSAQGPGQVNAGQVEQVVALLILASSNQLNFTDPAGEKALDRFSG